MATIDEIELSCYCINAINDIIIMWEVELISIVGQIKRLIFSYNTTRIDGVNALFCYIYFMLPHCSSGGKKLTIDIRQTNTVVIYNIDSTHAAACQDFHNISTNASNTKDGDTTTIQGVDSRLTKEELCSWELILHCIYYPLLGLQRKQVRKIIARWLSV